jgi:hypothetical protein
MGTGHEFRVMGFAMGSSKIAIKLSDFDFGSSESPLEPPFVGSVHCSMGRGFRLLAPGSLFQSLSLSFPLNLPESLSQLSLFLGLSLTLNLSVCVRVGRTEKKEEEYKRKEERSRGLLSTEERKEKKKEKKEKKRKSEIDKG